MTELLRIARQLGVSVCEAHLPEPYRGFYDHERRRVVYDARLTPVERSCVIAHELGHAFHDHRVAGDLEAEAAADVFAARILIDPGRLAQLEAIGLSGAELAEELGVSVKLLRVFAESHVTRMRGIASSRPRLGQEQFLHAVR
ncbi:ImmA/IrrE family metallo-endopeptidase [Microbacterium sp. KSW2-29]|uniref:ImmA/IrrE family metallo-endopeptidase n=1 Tax=Microbacterium phycohabitans TaxID=3075993 RepID=A0ABU3SIE8_9MICO|nr:ImmA/IrrE family metallo-endopeptidase [Microbacterium sp. KSW2-29]MDU0344548.1 ImmA/IrrE family metallo-endopeptidase [Microbacterium sp. KSW2-29]